jgi:hypothetical protein
MIKFLFNLNNSFLSCLAFYLIFTGGRLLAARVKLSLAIKGVVAADIC